MDARIILGRILQRFIDTKVSKVEGCNQFGFVELTNSYVMVTRENGQDTKVFFEKLLIGIEAYKHNPELYKAGPTKLRDFGLTHITSPIYSLLHLLPQDIYHNEPIITRKLS